MAALLFLCPLCSSFGQQASTILARLTGPDSLPVRGVAVELVSIGEQQTDSTGRARFTGLAAGMFMLRTRAVGYRPTLTMVSTQPGAEILVTIALSRTTNVLPAVSVSAESISTPLTDPGGFTRRLHQHNGGHFITEDEIRAKRLIETDALFYGIPTVQVDTGGIIVIKRGELSFRDYYLAKKDLNGFMTCIGAQVIVDGTAMPQPFNINQIPLQTIHGIEIYSGPATTPVPLRTPKTVCGTIAIWTK